MCQPFRKRGGVYTTQVFFHNIVVNSSLNAKQNIDIHGRCSLSMIFQGAVTVTQFSILSSDMSLLKAVF